MAMQPRPAPLFRPGISFLLLVVLLGLVLIAGGASRADVAGQVIVRSAAWTALIVAILAGSRPSFGQSRPVLIFLFAACALALLQLVPLPPAVWQALPGRAALSEAAAASGQPQPWRPWSIVPGATVNAAASLIVPFVVLVLVASLTEREKLWLPGFVLGLIAATTLVGLLQFSGVGFNNLLVNDTPGQVSGTFANRNHFALFLAIGCMLAPVWAFLEGRQPHWRGPVAFGLVLLFTLTILASGSRAGMVLGLLALVLGLIMVRRGIRRSIGRSPRWVFPALIAGIVGAVAIFVLISIAADRAVSIDRVLELDAGQDLRRRALPTILEMIRLYFPAGSGLGGFDQVFRMHEPFDLLSLLYLNHAHNDLLEIVLDTGLPGVLLLAAVLLWWAWASVRAWRAGSGASHALPKLGSAMLLLVMIASILDYPARTPMIMAMIILAGIWLSDRVDERPGPALPRSAQDL
ncbi:O-antigen ligase [Sphingomonas sp. LaA6.9]|uniref:O-antigen ligase family protein n=1 Tax=Sphingomonas sp. LaA6.9 TaxID=2919914 RepID=UPI001F4FEFDE|nr:O-antigen ligase family protein [Sphingomonas sp. LaA6.9]MCJ8158854.1 O-antigen ligase family protein [Sphingomonas sp. LaA6.9]